MKYQFSLIRLRGFLTLLLTSYFLGGIVMGLQTQILQLMSHYHLNSYSNSEEIFPVFSWFLFDRVPNNIQKFNIIIYEYNGKIFNPPVPWKKVFKKVSGARLHQARILIKRMGDAHTVGNLDEFNTSRQLFEKIVLDNKNTEYEIIQEVYNPLEKWKLGDSKNKIKSIGVFKTNN